MTKLYNPTTFENYVSNIFEKLSIYEPQQIDERYIANKLDIELVYSNFKPFAEEDEELNFRMINLNQYETKKVQREQFYHELNHILRHAGDQLTLPKTMIEWQEWDCKNFMLYAAIPYHMINLLKENEYTNIKHLSDAFGVTENIIEERLFQIKNRKEWAKYGKFSETRMYL